jgi:hypothetical protein
MKYAIVKDGVVFEVLESLDISKAKTALIIDITDMAPEPNVGWVLIGNSLQKKQISESEKTDIILDMRFKFGNKLADEMIKKMSKTNLSLIASGQTLNINTVISNFSSIESALRKCAVPTARNAIASLMVAYPEYTNDFSYALGEIDSYLAKESLL